MLHLQKMAEAADHLLRAVVVEDLLQSEVVGEGHHPTGVEAVAGVHFPLEVVVVEVVEVHLPLLAVVEVVGVHYLSKGVVVVVVVVQGHHPSEGEVAVVVVAAHCPLEVVVEEVAEAGDHLQQEVQVELRLRLLILVMLVVVCRNFLYLV